MADRCKNITLSQTSFAGSKKFEFPAVIRRGMVHALIVAQQCGLFLSCVDIAVTTNTSMVSCVFNIVCHFEK